MPRSADSKGLKVEFLESKSRSVAALGMTCIEEGNGGDWGMMELAGGGDGGA